MEFGKKWDQNTGRVKSNGLTKKTHRQFHKDDCTFIGYSKVKRRVQYYNCVEKVGKRMEWT